MAIDTTSEELISLTEAARLLPRRRKGKRPHVATLYRWSIRGVRGVCLETVQVGGTRCTSREAIARFIDRLSVANNGTGTTTIAPNSDKRAQAAENELDRLGIGIEQIASEQSPAKPLDRSES